MVVLLAPNVSMVKSSSIFLERFEAESDEVFPSYSRYGTCWLI